MNQTCTFCDAPAVSGHYLDPPMCPDHHTVAVLISLLRSYGVPPAPDTLATLAGTIYPRTGLDPARVVELAAPMLEVAPC